MSWDLWAEDWDLCAWTSELGLAGTSELGLVGAFELGLGTRDFGRRRTETNSGAKITRRCHSGRSRASAESPVPQGREDNHLIGEWALSTSRGRSKSSKNVRDAAAHGQVAAGSSHRHLSRRIVDANAGGAIATNPWMGWANIPRVDEDCLL